MRDSILVEDQEVCAVCGSAMIHRHHIFFGTSNRKLADEDGLWIPLCLKHHLGSNQAIHFNKIMDRAWKARAQAVYEKSHTREEFIARYGKSYL